MAAQNDRSKTRPADPSASQAALDRALDDLEAVLKREHGLPEAPEGPDHPTRQGIDDDGQYTIPLLNDVVVPGSMDLPSIDSADGPELFAAPPTPPPLSEDAACQHVVRRLASELDVIIQAGVEDALRDAKKRIMREVKNHIEITLPEILDEITQNRGTDPDRVRRNWDEVD